MNIVLFVIVMAYACTAHAQTSSPLPDLINMLQRHVERADRFSKLQQARERTKAERQAVEDQRPAHQDNSVDPDSEVELITPQQPQQPPQQHPLVPGLSPNAPNLPGAIPGLLPGQRVYIVHMPLPGYAGRGGFQPIYIIGAAPNGNENNANGFQTTLLLDPAGGQYPQGQFSQAGHQGGYPQPGTPQFGYPQYYQFGYPAYSQNRSPQSAVDPQTGSPQTGSHQTGSRQNVPSESPQGADTPRRLPFPLFPTSGFSPVGYPQPGTSQRHFPQPEIPQPGSLNGFTQSPYTRGGFPQQQFISSSPGPKNGSPQGAFPSEPQAGFSQGPGYNVGGGVFPYRHPSDILFQNPSFGYQLSSVDQGNHQTGPQSLQPQHLQLEQQHSALQEQQPSLEQPHLEQPEEGVTRPERLTLQPRQTQQNRKESSQEQAAVSHQQIDSKQETKRSRIGQRLNTKEKR